MAKKKEETVEEPQTDAVAEEAVEEKVEAKAEKKVKKTTKSEKEAEEDPSLVEAVVETAAATIEDVAEVVTTGVSDLVEAVTGDDSADNSVTKGRKRAEKVGIVFSDKMAKTVVVRVDRMVKHPLYHKYMKRRKKFMAHDELGATEGDRVRIVETRPLSARKRWRVVEIIQKAQK
jgi:small subunit ribosomal protein S17